MKLFLELNKIYIRLFVEVETEEVALETLNNITSLAS